MKIYIIDDDRDVIDLMTLLLEAKGHEIASNVAGVYALPEIRSFKPDCVLTDLVMAELNGLELCKELRAQPSFGNTGIIMVSARPKELWEEKAAAAGANGYIAKPLDPDNFAQQIEDILAT